MSADILLDYTGLTRYDGKIKTYIGNQISAKTAARTVTIATSDWSNKAATKSVTGVTASNTVVVSPAPASFDAYTAAEVKCTAQASGTLTFSCETVPSASLTVNVLIIN